MIKSESEIIDNMYKLVGIEPRVYSPQEYAKEQGTYEPGYMWPQYFFDAYPPFTKEKQYDIMMIFAMYVNLDMSFEPELTCGYILNFDDVTVNGKSLPDGLAKLVLQTYPKLKYDLQEQIREVLCH